MSRKPKRRASRVGDSLIAITLVPGPGVVARFAEATSQARELAAAKRRIERALRDAGMPKRTAVRVVSRMTPADIVTEAERVRAADPSN